MYMYYLYIVFILLMAYTMINAQFGFYMPFNTVAAITCKAKMAKEHLSGQRIYICPKVNSSIFSRGNVHFRE